MQSQEFDKLLAGDPAKWAESFQPSSDNLPKVDVRKEIAMHQTEIPEDKQVEINDFILLLMKLNVKEREIYRRVKKRFNISVV